jgi:hypothetical protein
VKEILVQEGQRVHKGLNADADQQCLYRRGDGGSRLIAKKIVLARLDAEISGAASFLVPPDLAPEIATTEIGMFNSARSSSNRLESLMNRRAGGRRSGFAAGAADQPARRAAGDGPVGQARRIPGPISGAGAGQAGGADVACGPGWPTWRKIAIFCGVSESAAREI